MIEQRTHRVCDVFGVARGVERYRIVVLKVDDEGQLFDDKGPPVPVLDLSVDLGLRGFRRLTRLLERGVTKPPIASDVPEPEPAHDAIPGEIAVAACEEKG